MRARNFSLSSLTSVDTDSDEYFYVLVSEKDIQATDVTVGGVTPFGSNIDPYGNINICGTAVKTVSAGSVELLFSKSSAKAETMSSVADVVIISARG